jgi:hypothetical protein
MKNGLHLIGGLLLTLGIMGGSASFFFHYQSDIAISNKLIKEGKKGLLGGHYEGGLNSLGLLMDSLENQDESVALNFAHCGFELRKQKNRADTTLRYSFDSTLQVYQALSQSKENRISSVAVNQVGVSSVLFSQESDATEIENMLKTAVGQFKEAIRKDPSNDSLRYNFELIQRVYMFPGDVVKTVDQLVKERKYGLAYQYLRDSRKRDARLDAYADMEQRLQAIYQIDQQP